MEKQTSRLESLSDGVFSVAMTLLAIDVTINLYPNATNKNLWQHIFNIWPVFLAVLNSFITVLLVWMGHHKMFKHLNIFDSKLVMVNGILLFFTVLLPIPTLMVGTFMQTDAEATAVCFYAIMTGAINLSMILLNTVIINKPHWLSSPEKTVQNLKKFRIIQYYGLIFYILAAVLAYYSTILSLSITLVMWVFWAICTQDEEIEYSVEETKAEIST